LRLARPRNLTEAASLNLQVAASYGHPSWPYYLTATLQHKPMRSAGQPNSGQLFNGTISGDFSHFFPRKVYISDFLPTFAPLIGEKEH